MVRAIVTEGFFLVKAREVKKLMRLLLSSPIPREYERVAVHR
jgi:hypothetical protein